MHIRIAIRLFAVWMLVTSTALAEAPKLPEPPKGFTWQWCDDVSVGLLRPTGWHFKEHKKNETRAYFITEERIEIDSTKENANDKADKYGFDTGLTLNVIPNVGKKTGGRASDYAIKFVRGATRDRRTVLMVIPPRDIGPAMTHGCRIKKDGAIVHYFLIADDAQDKLYVFMFESLEKHWPEAWMTGEAILKKFYIDFPDP